MSSAVASSHFFPARSICARLSRYSSLRGLSWIVNPYEDGGVVVAIEITLGAAIAGPFDIPQQALEAMITRVMARARKAGGASSPTVH